ncbi:MAG: hypothetical protein LIP16_20225 [Clostridium sp.]|nr:hypothetical protein [Clostridium sp.]
MNQSRRLKLKIFILPMAIIWFLMSCVTGCGINKENKELGSAAIEENSETSKMLKNQTSSLTDVMYSIVERQGLEGAVDYNSAMENDLKDAIVFLCKSESGKYEAYGFISAEYGKSGILINNVIDGQDNWNFFEENWSYGDSLPTVEEKADYEALFTFTQEKDGKDYKRSIYFDTYDTGTMSIRG